MSRRSRHGFTIVELLVTSVIATLLLGALLGLLGLLARDRQRVAMVHNRTKNLQRVADVMRRDMANSDIVEWARGDIALSLRGYAAIDATKGIPSGRAALIEYVIKHIEDRPVLIRRQRLLDDPNSATTQSELLADGIASLQGTPVVSRSASRPSTQADSEQARPRIWRVRMAGAQGELYLDESWVVR